MVPPPKDMRSNFNNELNARNGQNAPPVLFNPYQFQPPSINNFTMNFENPGNYHCFVDLNPCPDAVFTASQQLMNSAASGTWNNVRTQNGSGLVGVGRPRPPLFANNSSASAWARSQLSNGASVNFQREAGFAVQRFNGGPGLTNVRYPTTSAGRSVPRYPVGRSQTGGPVVTTSNTSGNSPFPTSSSSPIHPDTTVVSEADSESLFSGTGSSSSTCTCSSCNASRNRDHQDCPRCGFRDY